MLTLRQEQLDTLEQAAIRSFEERTYAHLQKYFPTHCDLLGKERMIALIHEGWRRAEGYFMSAECCVRTYIEFMCLLGGHFDTDPLLPWAAEILNDIADEQVERGDRLYHRAWEHIRGLVPDYRDAAGNPNTQRFAFELRQVRQEPHDPVQDEDMAAFIRALHSRIARVFPAKHHVVGPKLTDSVIRQSIVTADGYGIRGRRGLTLIAVVSFVLGRGYHDDVLLPWASAALNDPVGGDERRKVDRLFADGVDCLRAWWRTPHPHVPPAAVT
jgi:hypothetical protein